MKRISAILSLLLIGLSLSAGGWTEPKGGFYIKLDQSFLKANAYYDTEGNRIPIRTLGTYTTSLYARYGVHKKITLFGYIPFFVRNTLNETVGRQTDMTLQPGVANNGFGDMNLGMQYGIYQKKGVAMSLSLLLGIPSGSTSDPNGLFTGDGEFNQLLQFDLGYGRGIGKQTIYGNVYFGFNNRTKGFSEEFRWGLEAGVTLWKRLFIALKADGVESFQNGDGGNEGGIGLFANNVEFILYGPEIAYIHKEKLGVSFRYTTATKVKGTLASPVMAVGVFYKFTPKKKEQEEEPSDL